MKAYFNGEEVVVLEFGDNEKYGPMARVTFRKPVPLGMTFWIQTDQIMIQ